MKVSARLLPISGSLTTSFLTTSGTTAFVTILHRSLSFSVNGFVNPWIVEVSSLMLFSCRVSTELDRPCWCICIGEDMPARSLAFSLSRASSGEIRKNFVRAAGLRVIPTNPPATFMDLFICSSAWSAPIEQNGTWHFCSQPRCHWGTLHRGEDRHFSDSISARYRESFEHNWAYPVQRNACRMPQGLTGEVPNSLCALLLWTDSWSWPCSCSWKMDPQNSLHLLPGYRKLQNTNKQQLPILANFPFVCM